MCFLFLFLFFARELAFHFQLICKFVQSPGAYCLVLKSRSVSTWPGTPQLRILEELCNVSVASTPETAWTKSRYLKLNFGLWVIDVRCT